MDQIMMRSLMQNGGLTDEDIAAIADAPIAAIAGWKSGHAKPPPRHKPPPRYALILADLRHVMERLAAYYAPHEVRRWLHAPHPQLDGARPVDLIRQRRSIAVSAVIDRLDGEVHV